MGFIHSKDYVTNLDDKCIQPNAVDLRLDILEQFFDDNYMWLSRSTTVTISETGEKQFVRRTDPTRYDNGYVLLPRQSYDVVTKHRVAIPQGAVGWCHIRSTLSRNGIILSGGLYDAGYDGVIGFTLHNLTSYDVRLEDNVRIAQFIMAKAETSHAYDGHYNKNGGLSA